MKHIIHSLSVLLVVLSFSACDTYSQDDFSSEYVVESYLIAGEPLPALKLSETAPIDGAYRFEDYAVSSARVTLTQLNDAGETEKNHVYREQQRGIYLPADQTDLVEGGRQYSLRIEPAGSGDVIRASTIVPGIFTIAPPEEDTLIYQSADALLLEVSRSLYPGREAIYMNKLQALDTTATLTPLYKDLWEGGEVTKDDLVENSSGITNEANFVEISEETLGILVPWIGVAFLGPNDIVIDAIDDNLYDYARSLEENGSRPLGERDNPIDHIEGARGIFGSLARARVRVYVKAE